MASCSCARSSAGSTASSSGSETGTWDWSGDSLAKKLRYVVVFLLIVAAMGFLFMRMPTAYLPMKIRGS